MIRHTTFFLLCSCLTTALLFLATPACVHAQSTESDLQRLQSQKELEQLKADIAKAEKDKAEAEVEAFKARLGSLSTTNLPQGTVKAEGVVIEGHYLAYMAANSAAQVIADRVPCHANIFFFSAKDLDGIQALDALKAQIPLVSGGAARVLEPLLLKRVSTMVLSEPSVAELEKLYKFEDEKVQAFAPGMAFAAIDAGLSLLSLFKTDTEFRGVSITPDDLALQALVAQQWRLHCPGDKIVHPVYSYPPIATGPPEEGLRKDLADLSEKLTEISLMYQGLTERVQTPLAKAVENLRKLMTDHRDTGLSIPVLVARLKAATTPEEKKKIQADLDSANKHLAELDETVRLQYDPGIKPPAPGTAHYSDAKLGEFLERYLTDQLRADRQILALKALQTRMSDFVTALTKPDSNGVTPLVALLRAQALRDAKGEGANLLHVGFVTAGGNNIIKRNIFSSSLRFSGGVVAKYLLVDKDGYLTASGVVACYGGQLKEGDIKREFETRKSAMSCTEKIPQ